MNDCDKNWVQQEIEKRIDDKELFVTFNCPHCGHITIAKREHYINRSQYPEWQCVTSPTPKFPPDRYCFTCGKTFRHKTNTIYEEVKVNGKD